MPRRILVVAFAAALVLLAAGTPATAKGPDSATVTGPGIETMRLTWGGPDLEPLLQATRLWDFTDRADPEAHPPTGDLGPRFEMTYRVPDLHDPSNGKATLIRQELYPFAAAGPVVYMAEGQTMYDMELSSGWLSSDRRLTAVVKRLGGTARSVDSPPIEPATHEEATPSDGPARGLVVAGAAGAVLVATATAALLRRRVHGRA